MNASRIKLALLRRLRCSALKTRKLMNVSSRPIFNQRKGLLICGTGRSGTTWLAKLLSHSPQLLQYTEPLWEQGVPLKKHKISPESMPNPTDSFESGKAFFEGMFSGQILYQGWLEDTSIQRCWTAKNVLAKCIKAHHLLPWLVNNLELQGYIILVRHPCAVVASMMKHPNFKPEDALRRSSAHIDSYVPTLTKVLEKIDKPHEAFALRWALEQRSALSVLPHPKVHLLQYEDMVSNGHGVLAELWNRFELDGNSPDEHQMTMPSREAHKWSAKHSTSSTEERLSSWKSMLTAKESEDVLSIVSRCGLTGWSQSLRASAAELSVTDVTDK